LAARKSRCPPRDRRAIKALRRQSYVASAVCLALCYLAHGVIVLTGADSREAWAMAVSIGVLYSEA
jgi:hypothetical protein